jgi:hypothetical protein
MSVKRKWKENNSEGSEVRMKEMKREMYPKKLWCDHTRQWKKLMDTPYKPWYSCVITFVFHNYGTTNFFALKKFVV